MPYFNAHCSKLAPGLKLFYQILNKQQLIPLKGKAIWRNIQEKGLSCAYMGNSDINKLLSMFYGIHFVSLFENLKKD
jgi:hypothetical protein